jgi:DNA-binding NarL/FixJ family response regulator
MVALGLKNREIADNLGTTEQMVKNQLHTIYAKMRVENRLKLALWYEDQVHEGNLARHSDLLSKP